MQEKIKQNLPFLAFVALSLLAFWPTREAGFVTDWLGWHYKYRDGAWSDVITSFGYKGLHPVLHFFNYSLFRLFGVTGLAWYAVFASLHGVNAWLLHRFSFRLLGEQDFNKKLSLAIGFLFLLSPYSVESVVWRVCLHYLLSLFFCLNCLLFSLDFLEKQNSKSAVLAVLFFTFGLFSLEWSLVVPGIVVLLALSFYGIFSLDILKSAALRIVLPMAAMIVVYFGLNRWFLGDWVGHYGMEAHLNVAPGALFGTMGKYFLKHGFFLRFWNHPTKERIFGYFDQAWLQGFWAFLLIGLFVLWLYFNKKINNRMRIAGFAFFSFFVALLPVANLFFYILLLGENDRYGYMASAFFLLFAGILLSFLPKKILPFLFAGLLGLSAFIFQKHTSAWHNSNKVYQSLMDTYYWQDAENVLIMGIPENYEGVYMYRIFGENSALSEALELFRGIKVKGKIAEANRFNLVSPTAGLKVTREAENSFKIEFAQDGNWWWATGAGEHSLDGKWFEIVPHEWHREVRLLEIYPNTVYLYPVGGVWKAVE